MIKIKKYSNENLSEGRKICLENHLYIIGWAFQTWLLQITGIKDIFIIYKNKQPIGCSIVLLPLYAGVNFGIFIKKDFRKNGYGKKLINRTLKENKDYNLYYDYGKKGSEFFFEKTIKSFDNITRLN